MTNPEDPNRWGQPHQPDPGQQPYGDPAAGGTPVPPATPTTGPVTGATVSYNAAAFDDEHQEAPTSGFIEAPGQPSAPFGGQAPGAPTTGGFATDQYGGAPAAPYTGETQAPYTGEAQAPYTGETQAPYTDAYAAPPTTGGFASGPYTGETQAPYTDASQAPYTDAYQTAPATGSYDVTAVAPQAGYDVAAAGFAAPAVATKSSSKKPLLLGGGALVLVAALVAGYFIFFTFGGIKNDKGDIQNAKAFLAQAQSTWNDSLPEEGITKSDKAACYFAMNDSGNITNQVACGPVRRAGSEADAVWDYYHFSVTGSGDSQQAEGLEEQDIAAKAPTSGELVDLEGNGPADDGKGLAEPDLPTAEPDTVWTEDQITLDEKSKGDEVDVTVDSVLMAPGAQVKIDSIAEYSSAMIDGTPSQPADGQKFLVVTLTGEIGAVGGSLTNELSFDLNGTDRTYDGDPAFLGTTTLLISTPQSGTTSLVLNTEGHSQSIDLATGVRAEDATTAQYYTGDPEPTATLTDVLNFPAAPITAEENFSLQITLTEARLVAYDDEYGWAPPGQQWLVVDMDSAAASNLGLDASQYKSYVIDCTQSTMTGGTIKDCYSAGNKMVKFIASVDPGGKQFSFEFKASMKVSGPTVSDQYAGFGPVPAVINFP